LNETKDVETLASTCLHLFYAPPSISFPPRCVKILIYYETDTHVSVFPRLLGSEELEMQSK